ncbi:MAG TPA: 3-dehydroquinate synthase family protein [Candidatus Tumulicola sp.]|jgi:3-dehydroquinate synthase
MDSRATHRDLAATVRNDALGYPIYIAGDTMAELRSFVRDRGDRVVVLCDAAAPVHAFAMKVAAKLSNAPLLAFALGETRKRWSTVEGVLDAMIGAGADRDTFVIGVGGGVAADLFGFAAATCLRGVAYAHVATTTTAMVDAAIGGKTGVNLDAGKNLAGAFSNPVAVFCPADTLETLPFRELRAGLAEVLKSAIIAGGEFFESLEIVSPHPFWRWPWVEIIARAVEVKASIVTEDALESDSRAVLNLGHTFGHAFERASNYRASHGAGVAMGLRAAGLLALRTGRFSESDHLRVLTLMTLLGLPLYTSLDPDDVLAAMRSDKKKSNGTLRFVLPRAIGDVEYGIPCSNAQVRAVLEHMRHPPADGG